MAVTKQQIGITIDKDLLNRFKDACEDHGLKISPVIEALVEYFLNTLEEKIDD